MKPTYLLLFTACILASCKENVTSAAPTSTHSTAEEEGILKNVLAATPEGEPKSIHTVRASSQPGKEITIKGRIMGNSNPFVAGRSAFILGDPEIIAACNDTPGDACETPWDSCCNSPEEKKKGTATIQIVNADGRVLKAPLEGVGGLVKLSKVTVSGTVAPGSSADLLIVNATAIRQEK